uniref:NADH-ubiquinone oxidoreductase chain 4 n=1 Tax=Ishiharodelphax matsuyamensis TaxID=871437 RepID=A0A7S5DCN0_9HEMI|nr:NADH dehydrogenase subunit 4 [Ishiharodelphax matsuyamensis]QBZ38025.1 NADH dehydrogenase subunit 4 [Ishiharodelphax matsuyamensis]
MLSLFMSFFFLTMFSLKFNLYILIYFFYLLFFLFLYSFNFSDFFCSISFNMGLDYYSFCMVFLTFWLVILMMYSLLSLNSLYFSYLQFLVLLMTLFLMLCFFSLDYFCFYLYFECSILPVFFLIYGWGYQPERMFASLYFFMYTLFSSLPLFLLILNLNNLLGYFYFNLNYFSENFYLFFFFMFSFLVSMPMFFFHLWLPSAHVEAPSSGSMILAGIMLKLGGYGLIRVFFMFVGLIKLSSFFFISLSLFGSFLVSFFILLQVDLKVLVAYSSVSHMSLVICGLMTLSMYGYLGSLYLMISHGLVSSGLFYFVGCLFDRLSSRSLFMMKGLVNLTPSFMMFFFLLLVSNMSCPPSLNLISEILICMSLLNWDCLTFLYIFFLLFFSACAMVTFFSFISHGLVSGLLQTLDVGFIREFYTFFLHLFPLYFFFLNLDFFFLL